MYVATDPCPPPRSPSSLSLSPPAAAARYLHSCATYPLSRRAAVPTDGARPAPGEANGAALQSPLDAMGRAGHLRRREELGLAKRGG